MEHLVVRLGARYDDPVQWLVLDATGNEVMASGELENAGALATLPERTGHDTVVALAPTSEILLTWVTLPPRAGRKVISAIPYMLEDELASDISEQFFALGPKVGDEQAVAVVSRQALTEWQQWLSDAGLSCQHMLPDVLAVPYNQNGWALVALKEQLILREDQWKGMQGESTWILPAFSYMARQQTTPVELVTYTDMMLENLPNVNVQQAQLDLPMQVLAQQAIKSSMNLLQGEFKVKRKRSGALRKWAGVAVLALAVLITALVDKSITLYQLEQENASLNAQIDNAVKQAFPNMGAYRDVKRKVRQELARLQQGAGGGASMLMMLEQLRPAFDGSSVRPQTLRFDANRTEIRMQAMAANFEALEAFRRRAEQAGFTVEQGAINNRDNAVIGNVSIRSQS
ncbi:type II secretion system protein GspL [Salinimonas chungwhensis]|uniref:type II secretion system protein GspL n=1 Tax=Salinimonas chungwhensis TaxID=265425 RepID=UPI0003625C01|nr:type II secretion system protein GspL [Salinimonas chungwhensis]